MANESWELQPLTGRPGFAHEAVAKTTVWLTPPTIIAALGPFDLDPCAAVGQPWPTASRHFTALDDGLSQDWDGFVWCNPPFGPGIGRWLSKMAGHGNGIALVPARTETRWFVQQIWRRAAGILFVYGRIRFHDAAGVRAKSSIGTPICLVAYGNEACGRLQSGGVPGCFVTWDIKQGRAA